MEWLVSSDERSPAFQADIPALRRLPGAGLEGPGGPGSRGLAYFSAAFLLGSSAGFKYVMPHGPTPCSWMMVWPFAIP